MIIPSKLYDVLKWILMIVVPAFIGLLTTLTQAWGWDIPLEPIIQTITAIATFIGILIGVSTHNYNKIGKEDE